MKRHVQIGVETLLRSEALRKVQRDTREFYAAIDIVAILSDSEHPAEMWEDLKRHEPSIARWVEHDAEQDLDLLDLDGVLRLAQSIPSPRAERVKWFLAESGRRRLEEARRPELAFLRTRKLYTQRGYPRRWVEKRLGVVNSRHELTAEWYQRGVRESDDFRTLTNQLTSSAFGRDVRGLRELKGIVQPRRTLRDSMSDLELTLTSLAETTAAALSRARNSQGIEQLTQDAKDAGEIASATLEQIRCRFERPKPQAPVRAA